MFQERRKKYTNLIYGKHPILEAIEAGKTFERIFVQEIFRTSPSEVLTLIKEHKIPFQFVPTPKLNRLTTKNHQGFVGFISLVDYYKIEDVLPLVYEKGEVPFFLLLDGVTDVRNVGAIARSAVCCGVQALILPEKGSAQMNEDAIKSSSGALHKINICRSNDLAKTISFLQTNGLHVIGADAQGSKPLFQYDLNTPLALVMGSEDVGISNPVKRVIGDYISIPIQGEIDSFNVSVAAGILMYEAMKQRISY